MSPRSPEDYRRLRAGQRAHLAQVATEVFARKGLAATRISDIAAAAGVSQGLLHHYFKSKEALFATLVASVMKAATQVPRQMAQGGGTAYERLCRYLEVSLMGIAQSPEAVLLLQQAQSEAAPPALRRAVRRQGAVASAEVAKLVSAAQAEGAIVPGSPSLIAAHLVAFLQGVALQISSGPATEGFPDLRLLVQGVAAPARNGGQR